MQIPGFRLKDYLSESQIADLSSVQPLLGRPDFPSHPSRIAAGFISLICRICGSGKRLELGLKEGTAIDRVSQEILQIAEEECGNKFRSSWRCGRSMYRSAEEKCCTMQNYVIHSFRQFSVSDRSFRFEAENFLWRAPKGRRRFKRGKVSSPQRDISGKEDRGYH